MGPPTTKRTTSASAAKLRSLRIMLLTRSKRRKTKTNSNNNNNNNCNFSNLDVDIVKAVKSVENDNNVNMYEENAAEAAAAVAVTGIGANTRRATSAKRANINYQFKKYINNNTSSDNNNSKNNNGKRLSVRQNKLQKIETQPVEEQVENLNLKKEEEQNVQITSTTINAAVENQKVEEEEDKKLEKIKKIDLQQKTAAAAATNTTITTTTTANSPQPVKVFYDNRIKRKNVLALNEKVAAIREYEKMPVYKRIGRMFQCSPDQIKRIVQQKDSILKAWEQRTRRCQDAKTLEMKVVRVSMLGKAVYDWLRRMMYYKDFMITDGLIQKMALQFKSAMGLQHFFPHQDWCDKFRLTYKIFQHDSKLLNIGYTQGHSVQIKDIIKDVLSECTPDLLQAEPNAASEAEPAAKQLKLMPKLLKQERKRDENSNEQKDNNNSAFNAMPPIRKLQLPQLVSLPRTCGLGTHKVLVATPINTNKGSGNNAQNVNGNNNNMNGTSGSPMTMTIIPLATITQPMGNTAGSANSLIAANTKRQGRCVPPPMVEIKCEIKEERRDEEVEKQLQKQQQQTKTATTTTDTTTTSTSSAPPTTTTTIPVMPIAIKEELFSEEESFDDKQLNYLQKIQKIANKRTNANTKLSRETTPTTTPTKTTANVEDDTTDSLDYDNLALSSLKQIMQNKVVVAITTTTTTSITTTTTTPTTNLPKLTLKTTPTLTLTPIENLRATKLPLPPMVALSQLTPSPTKRHIAVISRSSTANLPAMPPLALQHLPPLTKAPIRALTPNAQLPLPALIPRSCSTGLMHSPASGGGAYRLPSQQRKIRAQRSPTPPPPPHRLSPIKSCPEARRYLKLLEDFALERENVRLIGLITRADEVVRELDGDDDVDID